MSSADNPYVGLRPFEPEDALYFFGRDAQTLELLTILDATRFLAVVGSSGCGKSSLLRAGLIPSLKAGFLVQDRDVWRIATLRPGGAPLANLWGALATALGRDDGGRATDAALVSAFEHDRVEGVVGQIAARLGTTDNLLLFVDQFEEIFAYRGGADAEPTNDSASGRLVLATHRAEAADFVDLLLALANRRSLPLYVVTAMRTDFLGDCDLFYGLPEALNRGRFLVPRLSRQQLHAAITGPARLMRAEVASRLVDQLLNELGDRFDRLPVLQHALMRTWDVWASAGSVGPIDQQHFANAGGLEGALEKDANSALDGLDEGLAARVFKRLTDTDINHRRVRHPVRRSELVAVAGGAADASRVDEILRRFTEQRRNFLHLAADGQQADPRVDISHESLIRQWTKLRQWVDEERTWRDAFLDLVARARRHNRNEGALLRDLDLRAALKWQAQPEHTRQWAARYAPALDFDEAVGFLDASRRDEEQRVAAGRRRTRLVTGVSLMVALGFALLSVWALGQQREAEASRREAWSAALAAQADEQLSHDPVVAAALVAALDGYPEPITGIRIGQSVTRATLPVATWDGPEGIRSVAYSVDGEQLALGYADGTIWWGSVDQRSGRYQALPVFTASEGWQKAVERVVFDGSGRHLAATNGSEVVLVDTTTREVQPLQSDEVRDIAFSPNGEYLLARHAHSVGLWRINDVTPPVNRPASQLRRPPLREFAGFASVVENTAMDAAAARLLIAEGRNVHVYDVSGAARHDVLTHEDAVTAVAFAPEGDGILTGTWTGMVTAWSSRNGKWTSRAYGARHTARVTSISVDVEGQRFATGSADGYARLWNLPSEGAERSVASPRVSSVQAVAFARASRDLVISVAESDNLVVWSAESGESRVLSHPGIVASALATPNAATVVTVAHDGSVRFWKLDQVSGPSVLRSLAIGDTSIRSALFSADGRRVVAATASGGIRVADVGGTAELRLADVIAPARVAMAANGSAVAALDANGTLHGWQLGRETLSPSEVRPVTRAGDFASIALSPDGHLGAAAKADGTVQVFGFGVTSFEANLGANGSVSSLAFSQDGARLAVAANDGAVRVWNLGSQNAEPPVASAAPMQVLKTPSNVRVVAFDSSGRHVIAADDNYVIRLWSLEQPAQSKLTLPAHADGVSSIAALPGTVERLLSVAQDGVVHLANTNGAGGLVEMSLDGPTARIVAAAFDPRTVEVATLSADGTARRWSVGWSALTRSAGAMPGACLTTSERVTLLGIDRLASEPPRCPRVPGR